MASEGEESSDEFAVLKNPIRRRILLSLQSRGELTASELKSLTSVSYGTLYYHLEMMRPYIESVGRGRFRLNDNGKMLLRRLMDERVVVEKPKAAEWWEMLTLGYLLSDSKRLSGIAAIGAALLAVTIYVSFKIDVYPMLLHFRNGRPPITSWPISLFALFGYLLAVFYLVRRDGGSAVMLLLSTSISYLPVAAYLSSIYIVTSLLKLQLDTLSAQIGFMISHIWQLVILASILTHTSGSGYSKTLPAMLFLSYISLITFLYL